MLALARKWLFAAARVGTAPLSVRVVTQLAGGGAPPSNSCHRPRQLSGLPRRRGPYSNHLHPGGIRIFRIFYKQTKTSSYQEQCSWHWFRRACHHARVGLALGQPPSARLTSVYAVSQRDFSLEFRLRDALSRMISVIRDSHTPFPNPGQRNASRREGGAAAHA